MFRGIYLYLATFLVVLLLGLPLAAQTDPNDPNDPNNPPAEPGITIEVGPQFEEDPQVDRDTVFTCINTDFHDKFPFDFVGFFNPIEIQEGSLSCPGAFFYGYTFEFCWVVELFDTIEPAIIISMMAYAIFNL